MFPRPVPAARDDERNREIMKQAVKTMVDAASAIGPFGLPLAEMELQDERGDGYIVRIEQVIYDPKRTPVEKKSVGFD